MPILSRPRRPRASTGPRSSHLYLMIQRTLYAVSPLECDPSIAAKAFRLNKPDGTLYDVAQTQHGHRCDCPDFIFRRDGLDPSGCKHVKALLHQGLLDHPEEDREGAGRGRRHVAPPDPRAKVLSDPGIRRLLTLTDCRY